MNLHESLRRRAYVVFGERPFVFAVSADAVRSAEQRRDDRGAAPLWLPELWGRECAPETGCTRVLCIGAARANVTLLAPGRLSVLEVTDEDVLALPLWLRRSGPFSGLIAREGVAELLVIDPAKLGTLSGASQRPLLDSENV